MREFPLSEDALGLAFAGSRLRAGLDVPEVAEAIGSNESYVARFETDATAAEVTLSEAIELLNVLGARLVIQQGSVDEAPETASETPKSAPEEVPPEVTDEHGSSVEWPMRASAKRMILLKTPGDLPHSLRFARLRSGLSMEEAALRVGVHPVTVSKHEAGEHAMTALNLSRYAAAYDVEFIIGGELGAEKPDK